MKVLGAEGEVRAVDPRGLAEGRQVYAYFNNDAFGYAVENALQLAEMLEEARS